MGVVAIVFAQTSAVPPLTVAGGSVALRQIRQLRHARVARIIVLGGDDIAPAADLALVATPAAAAAQLADDDAVLMLAPGLVIDERLIALLLAAAAPAIATWPAHGASPQLGTERIDPIRYYGGIGLYDAATVRATAAGLGDWDFHSTLLRTALGKGEPALLDLAAVDTYAPARRRAVPMTWTIPTDAAGAAAADETLIAAAQKGCLDWPARWLHPPLEDLLVRLLLPLPVTPNMVTIFVALLGVAAGVAFFNGFMWTGLILVLVSGPLDGVDGKLARVRTEFSRWGDLEHILDKACEYGWFLCIAAYLARVAGNHAPWTLAFMLILFALAEALQGEFFRRFTGRQLDDAGPFERKFRLVAGRRNTFFWAYVPFAIFGAWQLGFSAMTAYAITTFFVMQTRFFIRLEQFGRAASPQIDANFTRTAYSFLPTGSHSAS